MMLRLVFRVLVSNITVNCKDFLHKSDFFYFCLLLFAGLATIATEELDLATLTSETTVKGNEFNIKISYF